MNIEEYKSGIYQQQYEYKSFSPAKINLPWSWEDARINTLLSEANRKIGVLDAFALSVPDINIFIKMHVAKEATKSSRIEGTKTEFEEAFKTDNQILPENKDDWQEVQSYIEAMNNSVDQLVSLPVSTRLLKETHFTLMQAVRGQNKEPGQFRKSQNWLGGASIKDAVYIPPLHTEIDDLMKDLENFLHNTTVDVPELIRIGIAHYQFESIHPFLDGNGRIGRLLITLYLVSTGLLTKPSLYLSDYFEKHKNLYYDNLNGVRIDNNLLQWLKFFLVGVIETSNNSINTFKNIIKLKKDLEENKIVTLGKKLPTAKKLLSFLFKKPLIIVQEVQEVLSISKPTANALIEDFEKLNIITEKTGYKRNREFEFTDYLMIFKEN